MNIRKWLTGIVLFLLAPSLLFATLWIKSSLNDVRAIDRGLAGLKIIRPLGPLIRQRTETEGPLSVAAMPEFYDSRIFSSAEKTLLRTAYVAFLNEGFTSGSIDQVRTIVRTITQSIRLPSITTFETSAMTDLINNQLLTVIMESSEMVLGGQRLSQKSEINLWDRMSLPVQGGQFKSAADQVSRTTISAFEDLSGPAAERLRTFGLQYRQANGLFQNAGASLLMSVSVARTGADINIGRVQEVLPTILNASVNLWEESINYLIDDLQQRRTITIVSVFVAATIGLVIILAAFGLAILLSRSVADKTLEEFQKLGYHDPLTGLPNRRALIKTLDAMSVARDERRAGLVQVDLRHFKAINDRYGDHVGDAALRAAAEVFSQTSLEGDFIARTGGTEFMLLRPDVNHIEDLKSIAEKLTGTIGAERTIFGNTLRLETSAGVSISDRPGRVAEQLLTDAALALRSAKNRGAAAVCMFQPEMRDAFEKHAEIAKDLRTALTEGHIVAWYQPQVSLKTGALTGAEALVRWVDHKKGIRFPGSFLPAATAAGYMDAIDSTVRRQAMSMTARLLKENPLPFHVGLNISASLLTDPCCVDLLLSEVEMAGLQPSQIAIEILEAVMIDTYAAAPVLSHVAELSKHGFYIELDDFGTGHSSISSLRDLRVDRVKIDRSYVTGVDQKPELQKFTSALIQLARSLDISVLAEGVETEGERAWLAENGCDTIQGFLISKAVPETNLFSKAEHWNANIVPFHKKATTLQSPVA